MLERERLQPRYRRLAHTVGPREIGLLSAFRESLDTIEYRDFELAVLNNFSDSRIPVEILKRAA